MIIKIIYGLRKNTRLTTESDLGLLKRINSDLDKLNELTGKMKIEWGSQIRNYVLHPYKLIKDVRTGHETGNIDAVLDGEIKPFLKSFLMMSGQTKKTNDL